jgi:hypothetical protein
LNSCLPMPCLVLTQFQSESAIPPGKQDTLSVLEGTT